LGEFLAGIGFVPTAVVSSPKLRARQTAEAVADAVGASVTLDDRLGEGVELEMLDALADEFAAVESPGRLLLVGHDPDFSTVAAALCDAPSLQLSKGAVARIDLDGRPKPGAGRLRWLIPPDALAPPS
jgi:phosphohistidine phosphatase SixA